MLTTQTPVPLTALTGVRAVGAVRVYAAVPAVVSQRRSVARALLITVQ